MILKDLFEEKWWDDTNLIRLYHGTSSALLDLVHSEGLQPPIKQLDEYALEILEEYIPREQWTEKLVRDVHEHAARIGAGRAGDSGQVIFCMAEKNGPNGYATSLAEHGGEIARDVYEVACMFEMRKQYPALDDMPYQEYKGLAPPLKPRFANAHGVVLELLVPKDWCLFYIDPKQMKANIDKARDEGKAFAVPEEGQTMADVYDEIFDNREIRITRTVPPEMIVGVHTAVKESTYKLRPGPAQSLLEREQPGVSEEKIRELIKRFDNDHDREEATSGYCGTFALALYRYLCTHGEPAHLYYAYAGGLSHRGGPNWAHVFVKAHDKFWDVTGEINPGDEGFKDFYGVDDFVRTDEQTVLKLITHPQIRQDAYSRPFYNKWKNQLAEAAISVDDVPQSVKDDIVDMLLCNCPPFEEYWMKEHGIMSFHDGYVKQLVFDYEDNPFRVQRKRIPLDRIQMTKSFSQAVADQYAERTTKAPAILVRREGNLWRVVEGGHRFMAAKKRGDTAIDAYDVTLFFTCNYSELEG